MNDLTAHRLPRHLYFLRQEGVAPQLWVNVGSVQPLTCANVGPGPVQSVSAECHNMTASESEIDRSLMAAVATGDAQALASLYDRTAPRLLPAAIHILRDRADAEDLIHDVFVEAWQRSGGYDPKRGTVYSWLLVRVRSRAIDRLRSLKVAQKHAMLQKPIDETRTSQAVDADRRLDGSAARDALAALPRAQREVIELGYFRGMTCSEIAARCDIPIGTVKSRLSAALKQLRSQLAPAQEAT